MHSEPTFVGIDISKNRLDVAVLPQTQTRHYPNFEAGIQQLTAWLNTLAPQVILLEATGGYEFFLVAALREAQLPACFINPQRLRQFARSQGIAAKTDKLDARVLALFAQRNQPQPRPLPDEAQQELKHLMNRRRQLLDMLQMEHNRLATAPFSRLRQSHQAVIAQLRDHLQALEKDLDDFFRQHPQWVQVDRIITSCLGVGQTTSLATGAYLWELGHLNRRHRRPGGDGALQPGKRPLARPKSYRGRPQQSAPSPLHGHPDRGALQPGASSFLSSPGAVGQTQKSGPGGPQHHLTLDKARQSLSPFQGRGNFKVYTEAYLQEEGGLGPEH